MAAAEYDRAGERRQACRLCPAPPLFHPRRDQGLVGAGQPAEFRDGLRLGPVLGALTLSGADREPGDLG